MTHGPPDLFLLMLSWQLEIYPAITCFARGWNDKIRQIVHVTVDSVTF